MIVFWRHRTELSLKVVLLSLVVALVLSGSVLTTTNAFDASHFYATGATAVGVCATTAGVFITAPVWGPALVIGGAVVSVVGCGIIMYNALDDCDDCDGSGYLNGQNCRKCNPHGND